MHILYISEDIPFNGYSGSSAVAYELIKFFKKQEHKVTLCVDFAGINKEDKDKQISLLKKDNFNFIDLNLNQKKEIKKRNFLSKIIYPSLNNFFPNCIYKDEFSFIINKSIKTIKPDVVFAYGFTAIYLTNEITTIPRFAPMCEHPFAIQFSNLRSNVLDWNFRSLINLYQSFRIMKQIKYYYKNCNLLGHSSEDFRQMFLKSGLKKIKYYNHPVNNSGSLNYILNNTPINKKFKIILLGALSSVTTAQYIVLQKIILPKLKKIMPKDSFEIHLIGAKKNSRFKKLYDDKYIIWRGYVDNIEMDLSSCDIFLSPTPNKYGLRVRLIHAMIQGCLVVTTKYDEDAFPLIKNNFNALVANCLIDIPDIIFKSYNNLKLRKSISFNAKQSTEKFCFTDNASRVYEKDMLDLVEDYYEKK
tara:strand:- start:1647 stop:2894 length:1248 start_codon:yes stop_codon:yes gene_type:complete